MKAERLIHTTVNGSDKLFATDNYMKTLNSQNTQESANCTHQAPLYFADDLAVAQTTLVPDFEESTGRMFTRTDSVIIKYDSNDLVALLTPVERIALLQRAYAQIQSKVLRLQSKDGLELKNPLPQVII